MIVASKFIDNPTLTHTGINVLQSTDYYPPAFANKRGGLVMREQKDESYRFGYQGQFAEMDPATGWHHFELRQYDALAGRWLVVDPARQFGSGYIGMGNNPVNGVDPDGKKKVYYNADGSYSYTTNDNWLHNLLFGTHNFILDGNGNSFRLSEQAFSVMTSEGFMGFWSDWETSDSPLGFEGRVEVATGTASMFNPNDN